MHIHNLRLFRPRKRLFNTMSVLAFLAAGTALPSGAWAADGGYGGASDDGHTITTGAHPGTDGDAVTAHGEDGGAGLSFSGGGGGATNLATGQGTAGGRRSIGGVLATGTEGATGVTGATGLASVDTTINGGAGGGGSTGVGTGGGGVGVTTTGDLAIQAAGHVGGGAGGFSGGLNGGGGGGGVGVFSSANVSVDAGGTVAGGAGGKGGSTGSGGGGGAAAILLTGGGIVTNSGTLTGGKGGDAGNYPFATNGGGGSGAEGVLLTGGGTVINNSGGSISGGAAGGYKASLPLPAPTGGAGIKGANVSVINAGTIAGGGTADAISFTGGVNSLELQAGSVITGNVVAFSAADSFTLGGDTDASFDVTNIGAAAQYRGFGVFTKTGASTWTLIGATTALTPWLLDDGTLAIATDTALGDSSGTLTFDGGTLETTADIAMGRAVLLDAGGGTINTAAGTTLIESGIVGGAGGLTKAGAGTLELTGLNSFTGATTIAAGTLALTAGGSIAASSGVVDNADFDISGTTAGASIKSLAGSGTVDLGTQTLTLTAASDTFSGGISGNGGLTLAGGTEILSGANAYLGPTTVSAGTVAAGAANAFSAASAHTILAGGVLDLAGFDQTVASLDNAGTVRLGGAPGTVLTVTGNYTGNGGALDLNAALGTDGSPTDLLHIEGDSVLASAATRLKVTDLGGAGGTTGSDGIRVVQVDGSSAAGAFALAGPAIGGAYRYDLFQNGVVDTTDGDWYLRSAGLAPTTPTYETYPVALLGMIDLPTLAQRLGERQTDGATGVWTRIEGGQSHVVAGTADAGASYDSSLFLAQLGMDTPLLRNDAGVLVGGLNAQYNRDFANVFSPLGNGANLTTGYGIGATLTWYGKDGFYLDAQSQLAAFSSDLSAAGIGSLVDGNKGYGFAASLETGRKLGLTDRLSITPQAQLSYSSASFDDFTDPFGAVTALRNADSLKGRIGVSVDYDTDWTDARQHKASSKLYGVASLTNEFLGNTTVAVSGTDLSYSPQKFGGELGLGGNVKWGDGAFALHGEVAASSSFAGSYGVGGTFGFKGEF